MGKLFGTDGVRGKAGAGFLTSQNIIKLGVVVARLLKPKKILIARDTRQSGKMIESNLIRGLALGGKLEIKCMGIVPTPALAYLTKKHRASLGAVISASHNPFYDNGIKFFSSAGVKISDLSESKI
ncbi:phosphoglucosamine mutase, partial [Candidatus Peregrinibacteria bacterium]|nr:phosphoglucosamine mutase [Candidatus Peregrinibacteria bacterium]